MEKDKAHWLIRVPLELDRLAFESAHKLRMSKSAFIREAVEERIARDGKTPAILVLNKGDESFQVSKELNEEYFKPQPKSGKKKK